MNSHNLKDYKIKVESGKLTGSVRISGELPEVLSNAQACELEEAIRAVRGAEPGWHMYVAFTVTQPRDASW